MKRRRLLITGVLLLLGGAIVNVAVAWGCATLIYPFDGESASGTLYDLGGWQVSRRQKIGVLFIHLGKHPSRPVPEWSPYFNDASHLIPAWGDVLDSTPAFRQKIAWAEDRFLSAYGWPALSLWGEAGSSLMIDVNTVQLQTRWAVEVLKPWQHLGFAKPRIIPLRPIRSGFAINTIFYAAMLWVVFFVPGMARRRIRRRRGRCPACAYPIGTSPVCTECGKALA